MFEHTRNRNANFDVCILIVDHPPVTNWNIRQKPETPIFVVRDETRPVISSRRVLLFNPQTSKTRPAVRLVGMPMKKQNAVKLKAGPIFALFKVKNCSNFFVCFAVLGNLVLPAERRLFRKCKKENNIKKTCIKVKTGPIMLCNILGSIFNFDLDQFLTLILFFADAPVCIVF